MPITIILGFRSHRLSTQSLAVKDDLVELSSIKYGLFNVDEWKRIVFEIVAKKVEDLEVTGGNRPEMKVKIETLLTKIIEHLESDYQTKNKGSIKGWLKRSGAVVFGIFDHLKREIPVITEDILKFLESKENRTAISDFINQQIQGYADSTFSETDYSEYDDIILQYGATDKVSTIALLQEEHNRLKKLERWFQGIILGISTFIALMLLIRVPYSPAELTLFTIFSFMLLGLGLSLPMIDIDARISSLKFTLLGEPVAFTDQILYYKSKSILEVVSVMLGQKKFDVALVGVLVLSFSVLFPLSKLIATNIYLYVESIRKNEIIKILAFKTGKWSMADVMVVAIFMAYMGFSGILGEQLSQLDKFSSNLEVLTTNYSTLQGGFFFFTAFAVISILISQKISTTSAFNVK